MRANVMERQEEIAKRRRYIALVATLPEALSMPEWLESLTGLSRSLKRIQWIRQWHRQLLRFARSSMSARNHIGNYPVIIRIETHHLHSKAADLFQDEEELLQHIDDCGFDKTPILLKLERLEEAAENQLKRGQNLEAIDLLIRAKTQGSMQRAAALVLDELWLVLPYNQRIMAQNQLSVARLLGLADSVIDAPESWVQEVCHFVSLPSIIAHQLYRWPCSEQYSRMIAMPWKGLLTSSSSRISPSLHYVVLIISLMKTKTLEAFPRRKWTAI